MSPGDIPHRAPGAAGVFIFIVMLWLIPLSIWAYATRPTAAVGSASIHKPYGPAPTAHASTDGVSGKASP
jgi:hypothetical protein